MFFTVTFTITGGWGQRYVTIMLLEFFQKTLPLPLGNGKSNGNGNGFLLLPLVMVMLAKSVVADSNPGWTLHWTLDTGV